MKHHDAAIIVAVLLLLTVLYVGSYFTLVVPGGRKYTNADLNRPGLSPSRNYRIDVDLLPRFFAPLEQIDRKLRPKAWEVDPFG